LKIKEIIMFELKITNLQEATRLAQRWATHTVSILDPETIGYDFIKPPEAGPNSLLRRYYFHDLTPGDTYFIDNPVIASVRQIEDILTFTAALQVTDKLLIHCHAGISRSTAVAIGVLCQHGVTPYDAVTYVLTIRPQAHPNQYIIRLFDEILMLNGELSQMARIF
jgi:predicted protein tyrosine phosphatase